MDIAFLTIPFTRNGREATEITLMGLAEELAKKGHSISIISKQIPRLAKLEKRGKITIYRPYNSEIMNILFGVLKVQRIRKKKFEVIHNFSAAPVLSSKLLPAKLIDRKVRTVSTLKSYSKNSKYRFSFLKLLKFSDMVVVPTKIFEERLTARGVPASKIEIIRSNINTNKFKPTAKTPLKKKHGLRGPIVLYYGALWEGKGLQFLVNSMPDIIKKHPTVNFVIAPRHWIRERDAPMINRALKNGQTQVVENIPNITEYVNMADVVVLPYKDIIATEGNPSCLLESMACKTAVVTSRLPELQEIVEDGKDVLMVNPGDTDALARQINKVLSGSKLRKRLVESAYKKSKQFGTTVIADEYIKLYSRQN